MAWEGGVFSSDVRNKCYEYFSYLLNCWQGNIFLNISNGCDHYSSEDIAKAHMDECRRTGFTYDRPPPLRAYAVTKGLAKRLSDQVFQALPSPPLMWWGKWNEPPSSPLPAPHSYIKPACSGRITIHLICAVYIGAFQRACRSTVFFFFLLACNPWFSHTDGRWLRPGCGPLQGCICPRVNYCLASHFTLIVSQCLIPLGAVNVLVSGLHVV